MKIRIIRSTVVNQKTVQPGKEVDVSSSDGRLLIGLKKAELVGEAPAPKPKAPVIPPKEPFDDKRKQLEDEAKAKAEKEAAEKAEAEAAEKEEAEAIAKAKEEADKKKKNQTPGGRKKQTSRRSKK